ncbi:MAG: sigma factor-like helix-turn-helix DNA-binding protein, partial [Phycisphaerae bacterium]
VLDAIDSLDPVFREVIILSALGGLSYQELAELLSCPIGTVMSRMCRARRELRQKLWSFAPGTKHCPENIL